MEERVPFLRFFEFGRSGWSAGRPRTPRGSFLGASGSQFGPFSCIWAFQKGSLASILAPLVPPLASIQDPFGLPLAHLSPSLSFSILWLLLGTPNGAKTIAKLQRSPSEFYRILPDPGESWRILATPSESQFSLANPSDFKRNLANSS